jgi:hypothetical protein
MDTHLFRLLQQQVHKDHALQARLFELTDRKDFFSAIQALAEELGHPLEETDMIEAIRAGRRAWSDRNKQ